MTTETDVLALILEGETIDTDEGRAIAADLDRISRGMELAATQPLPQPRRSPSPIVGVAAAAVVAVITAGVLVANNGRDSSPDVASPTSSRPVSAAVTETQGPGVVLGVPAPELTIEQRVAQAERIVVGDVTRVTRGELRDPNGESIGRYVLATVSVSESLKPADAAKEVVAFTYDYGGAIVSSEGETRPWAVGQRVLLFLLNDKGTVSEKLQPAHLQVAEGESGRYFLNGDTLDAPFTLDDVRRLVR